MYVAKELCNKIYDMMVLRKLPIECGYTVHTLFFYMHLNSGAKQ